MNIRTRPEPYCPTCGAKMTLRRPQPHQNWKPFWGCGDYPDCRGKRAIDDEGNPVNDEEIRLPKIVSKDYDWRVPQDATGVEGKSNRCAFVWKDGARCSAWAMQGGSYCKHHFEIRRYLR